MLRFVGHYLCYTGANRTKEGLLMNVMCIVSLITYIPVLILMDLVEKYK